MALTVRELLVSWGFKVDDKKVKAFSKTIRDLKSEASAVGDGVKSIVKAVGLIAGAATGAAAALFGVAKSVADAADAAGEGASRAGVGVEAYQELAFAAKDADVGVEGLETALSFLGRQMVAAKKGSKDAVAAFGGLGVEVKDLKTGALRPTEEVLKDVATAFKNMKDGPVKNAAAIALFSRSGKELIPVLNAGREGLDAMGDRARMLGLVFTEDMTKAGDRFNKEMGFTLGIVEGLKNAIGLELMPVVQGVIVDFGKWLLANRDLIRTKATQFVQGLSEAIKGLWGWATQIWGVIQSWVKDQGGWNEVIKEAGELVVAFGVAWAAFKTLDIVSHLTKIVGLLVANPWALVATAAVLAAVLIVTHWEDVKGIIEEVGNSIDDAGDKLDEFLGIDSPFFGAGKTRGKQKRALDVGGGQMQVFEGTQRELEAQERIAKMGREVGKPKDAEGILGLFAALGAGVPATSAALASATAPAGGHSINIDSQVTLNFPQGTSPQIMRNAEEAHRKISRELDEKNLRRAKASLPGG